MIPQANLPCSDITDVRSYYRAKRKLHFYKTKAPIIRNGIFITLSSYAEKKRSRFFYYRRRYRALYGASEKKYKNDFDSSDTEEGSKTRWAFLVEK